MPHANNHYYEVHGSGIPVVFIHGMGGSCRMWRPQREYFVGKYQLILYDVRGHGQTGGSTPATYTPELLAEDLLGLLDHLGVQRAHVVSLSMGTLVAQAFAAAHPDRVLSLTLAGAVWGFTGWLKRLATLVDRAFVRLVPMRWLYPLSAWLVLPRPKGDALARHFFVRESQKMCKREFLKIWHMTRKAYTLLGNRRIKDIPTLIVMGKQDFLFAGTAGRLLESIRSARLIYLERCGHVVSLERAQEFNRLLEEFLSQVSRQPEPQPVR